MMLEVRIQDAIRVLWQYLREVSGENDYARYRKRVLAEGRQPMTAREFYAERQQEKYSRPSRCC